MWQHFCHLLYLFSERKTNEQFFDWQENNWTRWQKTLTRCFYVDNSITFHSVVSFQVSILSNRDWLDHRLATNRSVFFLLLMWLFLMTMMYVKAVFTFAGTGDLVSQHVDLMHATKLLKHHPQVVLVHTPRDLANEHLKIIINYK